jgi:NADPH:quinone reductase-like Zn-dependent oxidoreductase
MKAIVYTKYGPPDVLHLKEVEKPTPNENQLLVRVRALSLTRAEPYMRSGKPPARLLLGSGLLRPKNPIPGADFAGRVEAVGKNVAQFKPGDEVFGRRSPGGFAEYLCVSEKPVVLKPANATFEQAAALTSAGLTALQSVRDGGQIRPGQNVLINGASGGVGTFTVQIAKAFGADVTAVCSTRNLELVRSIGADRVIDYTQQDFSRNGQRYDLIIDNVGNHSLADYRRALTPTGICVIVGFFSIGLLLQHLILGRLLSRIGNQKISITAVHTTKEDLTVLKELVEAGKVVPVIDRTYPFHEVVEAHRYVETGHARAKVVVTVNEHQAKAA